MSHSTIILNINGTEFEAEVEYTEAWHKPARTHLAPEDCYEAEGEDIIVHSLYMPITVCGIDTKQDVFFLIDSLMDDIREQLSE
jgi:hypothetical protein